MSLPRFLADEDLRRDIIRAARRLEPRIVTSTVQDEGLGGAPDDAVLEFASAEGWLVVSHDVNTMKAAAEARLDGGQEMNGLFLVPQSRATSTVAESLVLICSASEAEEWRGQVVYLPLR